MTAVELYFSVYGAIYDAVNAPQDDVLSLQIK